MRRNGGWWFRRPRRGSGRSGSGSFDGLLRDLVTATTSKPTVDDLRPSPVTPGIPLTGRTCEPDLDLDLVSLPAPSPAPAARLSNFDRSDAIDMGRSVSCWVLEAVDELLERAAPVDDPFMAMVPDRWIVSSGFVSTLLREVGIDAWGGTLQSGGSLVSGAAAARLSPIWRFRQRDAS
jgi:hypothetical protein